VIDHHPVRPGSARAAWCDIRPDFGATSTIVFEYLRTRGVPLDARLATAFFFALRTETRDLGRESTNAERDAYLSLITQVDHGLLYRMSHPKVPCAHFAALDRALRSAQVFGDIVAVNLGTLRYPDLVAEIADLLLSYESARMVLCIGEYEKNAYLSLRMEADNARAGAVMRHIVGHDGAAGGHGTMAGARLFATVASEESLEATFQEMVRRLLEVLGHPPVRGEPLLRLGNPRQ
jgi:nanoRNase/pAp phosphatase (c-di-AMP/oligoRNAs hydrolase)